MPKNTATPTAWRISEPEPVDSTSGSTPRMNANDVIRIGRRRSRAGLDDSLQPRPALALDVARELDDQDRVLGGKSHQHHEADLGQDVDVLAHDAHADGGREQAHRHDQDHRERQRPAAILRRQHQIDEQHTDREHIEAGIATRHLLIGQIGPFEGKAARQCFVGELEPLLVAAMLFQIGTGLFLAWRWSAAAHDFQRTYQVASGAYFSLFILGHMNSVFVYARSFLGIPTDWNFAIGAPTGLVHDAWNIRLLPHYALGAFFVLSHLASGLRVVLIAHGVDQRNADRLWGVCVAMSTIVAAAIIAGMSGVRIGALAS